MGSRVRVPSIPQEEDVVSSSFFYCVEMTNWQFADITACF
jgi:hypothetical protein